MNEPLDNSVTLEEVFAVVTAKRVPLAPELAGYLALEVAEGANSYGGDLDPRTVFIGEEGTVALVRPKSAAGDVEASLRVLLHRLLDASGSSTPALTSAARRKPGTGLPALVEELEAALIPVNRAAGRRALARLAREVKRVTAGVGRNAPAPERPTSTQRPTGGAAPPPPEPVPPPPEPFPDLELVLPRGAGNSAPAVPPSSEAPAQSRDAVDSLLASFEVSGATTNRAVSRELKAMVGIEPTPPAQAPVHAPPRSEVEVEALLAMTDQSIPIANMHRVSPTAPTEPAFTPPPGVAAAAARPPLVLEPPPPPPPPPSAPAAAPRHPDAARSAEEAEERRREAATTVPNPRPAYKGSRFAKTVVLPREQKKRARRTNLVLGVLTLVVLAVGAAALWRLKPGYFTGRTPEKLEQERLAAAAAASRALAQQQQARCRAQLTVTDVPGVAEVLLRRGKAPIEIDRMPVGARLEFVATAESFAPKRAVIPAGATWESGPDGKPRFELPVQLEPSRAKPGAVDPWPAGQPGTVVGGKGAPGTVRVLSNPRGAEIWLLVGAGPEATIDPIPCDQDTELLVAGPAALRRRLKVTAADVAKATADANGLRAVRISAGGK